MELKPQKYQTDDGLITLLVDKSVEVTADSPKGFEDWFVALEPGPWHTHPELIACNYMVEGDEAVELYIQEVLADKLTIKLQYEYDTLVDTSIWNLRNANLNDVLAEEKSKIRANQRVVFRYWSGKQIAEINSTQS